MNWRPDITEDHILRPGILADHILRPDIQAEHISNKLVVQADHILKKNWLQADHIWKTNWHLADHISKSPSRPHLEDNLISKQITSRLPDIQADHILIQKKSQEDHIRNLRYWIPCLAPNEKTKRKKAQNKRKDRTQKNKNKKIQKL